MKFVSLIGKSVYALILGSSLILSACGGGGDSSPSPVSSNASSSSATSLVANPGSDVTINAGEKINLDPHATVVNPIGFTAGSGNLEIKGSSTVGSDIVNIKWTKVSGPAIALSTQDTTSGKASFIAPSTGTAATLPIVYKLTITNAAGTSDTANVTFTVNRVNQAPTVTASTAATSVTSNNAVAIQATATDSDGTIASYTWTQVSGPSVNLQNANTDTVGFEAPATSAIQNLVFNVEAADNDGAKTSAQVTIQVISENAPVANVLFPRSGIYTESTISAFGNVTTKNSATLTDVSVDAGTGAIAATVTGNSWRVDNLTLPAGMTSINLIVKTTDSEGQQGESTVVLTTDEKTSVGNGSHWSSTVGISYDSSGKIDVLAADSKLRLFSIDTMTGNRSSDISDFNDATQGIAPTAFMRVLAMPIDQKIYATLAPSDLTEQCQVISINTVTGQRALVSDSTQGTGAGFSTPVGMAIAGQTLYVADNGAQRLVAVDIATGNRTVVASINVPVDLAYDSAGSTMYVAPNIITTANILKLNLAVAPVATSTVTDTAPSQKLGTGSSFTEPTKAMFLNARNNELLVVDKLNQLIRVDIATGNRTALASLISLTGVAFDEANQLLYYASRINPNTQALSLVDLASLHKVIISQ